MPTDPYPILEIQPEWVLEAEAMGSKRKFWYRQPGPVHDDWLFKFPKPNTGLHWAEKIAAEIAALMKIRHAPVELAIFQGEKGSATQSFARDGRNLFHGNQVLSGCTPGYDSAATFRHANHSLPNIFRALDWAFTTDEARERAKRTFGQYLILDALIGNVDRHHENWGLLRKRVKDQWVGFVAPTFDHASSMGRELLDERRSQLMREGRVGRYCEQGRGGIFWDANDKRAPSPLELVRRAVRMKEYPLDEGLAVLSAITQDDLIGIVARIPDGWMTPPARDFTLALLRYNLEQLKHLTP